MDSRRSQTALPPRPPRRRAVGELAGGGGGLHHRVESLATALLMATRDLARIPLVGRAAVILDAFRHTGLPRRTRTESMPYKRQGFMTRGRRSRGRARPTPIP